MNTRRLPALAASFTLLALATCLFFPALFQGKILAPLDITTTLLPPWSTPTSGPKPHNQSPSDAVTQYLPYRMFAEKSLREDGYIGWNPYEMGGYSLAGNTMALPGSWPMQLHRWLPFKDAWNLGIIAEFLIAGSGMLVFLRSRGIGWLPCLIGSVAFMLNAQFIVWIYHRWALGSFSWMPWACWAVGSGLSARPLPTKIFLLPGFLALAFLGGSIQHAVFVVFACGCLAAGQLDWRRPLANVPNLVGWSLAGLLALGMAAFSLVPQVSAYLSNIAIGHTRGGIGYEDGWIQPLLHALLIPARIWPWLVGDPQTIDGWKAFKSDFFALNYLGTIPMLLAFAALWMKTIPAGAKWLIVVGLVVPLTPLVGPLYHRVELLFILGAAWATAEMLQQLSKGTLTLVWPRWLLAGVAAIGLGLTTLSLLPSSTKSSIEQRVVSVAVSKGASSQFGADHQWLASRGKEWASRLSITHPRTAWVYGLLALGSVGLVMANRKQGSSTHPKTSDKLSPSHVTGQCLILLAVSLELSTLFHTWAIYADPADLRPNHVALDTARTMAGPHRVLQTAEGAEFATIFATPNLLAAQSIPSIDGYESIQYRSPLVVSKNLPPATRLDLAGVGLAIQPPGTKQPGTEAWPIVAEINGYVFRKHPSPPAPISTGAGPAPKTLEEIVAALPNAQGLKPSNQTTNRLSFDVTPSHSWVRIAQNWHPGWKWRLPNQAWNPCREGADAACWIDLPANASKIEVRFFPIDLWPKFTSFASLVAIWGLMSGFLVFRRRESLAPTIKA